MTWLLIWKVVLAAAAAAMWVHIAIIALNATRDVIQEWKTPRGEETLGR
jgi:hypothetical protein